MMEILAYTPTTLAEAMCVSRPTVYRWMNLPGFPVAKLGNCVRIPVRAFERWLDERQAASPAEFQGKKPPVQQRVYRPVSNAA